MYLSCTRVNKVLLLLLLLLLFDKHGDGVKIMFPVKIRKFLCPSPKTYQMVAEAIVEAPRTYTEKLSVKFLKVSASCN